jgi:four helix bundle protein
LQEARAADSRADFIHKLQMALKEMREARNWLNVARVRMLLKSEDVVGPCQEADELVAILSQSVLTAKQNVSGTSNPTREISKM